MIMININGGNIESFEELSEFILELIYENENLKEYNFFLMESNAQIRKEKDFYKDCYINLYNKYILNGSNIERGKN